MINRLFDLSGRAALVTGGSRGLGKAMATVFAQAGASVVISSRHEDELRAAAAEIRDKTQAGHPGHPLAGRGSTEFVAADMTSRDNVRRLANTAVGVMGKIDILVNNAGFNVPQPIDQILDEDWDRLVELNLTSCMVLTRALVPGMKERRWGRIIHISSIMGLASTPGRNAYSATKSALLGMAKASALDLGPFNVTVNCIAPGPFATEMPMSILSPEQQAALAARTALNRWGQPEELAGPALLLASEAGSYITGAVLLVDGGALARVF